MRSEPDIRAAPLPRPEALLYRVLLRVRPIALAARLKRVFRVRRFAWQLADGRRYWIDPVSNLGRHLLFRGAYEPAVERLFSELLRPGDAVLDIGSNEGYFAVFAGQRVGDEGVVHAFEPQSRLQDVLSRNASLNGMTERFHVHRLALGREAGRLELQLTSDVNTGASGASRHWRFGAGSESVAVETLDAWGARNSVERVRLAKIDVEGAEEHAVAGASAFLAARRADFVVVEFHPHICGAESCARADRALRGAGYSAVDIDGIALYHAVPLPEEVARRARPLP